MSLSSVVFSPVVVITPLRDGSGVLVAAKAAVPSTQENSLAYIPSIEAFWPEVALISPLTNLFGIAMAMSTSALPPISFTVATSTLLTG